MTWRRLNSACLATLSVLTFAVPAHAFKILSPITEGCHERMLLGTLGNEGTGFNGDGVPSTATLLQMLVARMPAAQIPDDDGTQGLIQEMTNRYGWNSLDISTRFVLASFVAGVREPDTDGFSVSDLNILRGTQINDDAQSAHILRMIADDGDAGNVSAIQRTRDLITTELNGLTAEWNQNALPIRSERWTFAFYAVNNVTIFSPAYDLGLIAHTIQDSYAHTIRDDNFNILAVANYIEVMLREFDESRDGPAHSERLDQCNLADTFDSMRITEARKQLANFFNQVQTTLQAQSTDLTAPQAALDTIFSYTAGCDFSNSYCGASWYGKSQEGVTRPYSLGCGQVISKNGGDNFPPPDNQRWPTLLTLLAPLLLIASLRFRPRRTKASAV